VTTPSRGLLVEARSVSVTYRRGRRTFTAVRDVDLVVERGQTVGVVGESG
jgi:ABC-type dipeptide/oligopeptide/nickel transport system ATPase subunit